MNKIEWIIFIFHLFWQLSATMMLMVTYLWENRAIVTGSAKVVIRVSRDVQLCSYSTEDLWDVSSHQRRIATYQRHLIPLRAIFPMVATNRNPKKKIFHLVFHPYPRVPCPFLWDQDPGTRVFISYTYCENDTTTLRQATFKIFYPFEWDMTNIRTNCSLYRKFWLDFIFQPILSVQL